MLVYKNGNYLVRSTRTSVKKRAFRVGEELRSDFPDSIDLKITNKCNIGCSFCHECSIGTGNTFNLEETKLKLEQLPEVSLEVAIGGGDIFECLPDTVKLAEWLKSRGNSPRITINAKSIFKLLQKNNEDDLKLATELLKITGAVGISVANFEEMKIIIDELSNSLNSSNSDLHYSGNFLETLFFNCYIVFHVIAGIIDIDDFKKIIEYVFPTQSKMSILILGYKQWGRAKDSLLPMDKLQELSDMLKNLILNRDLRGKTEDLDISSVYPMVKFNQNSIQYNSIFNIGFDNLALEQLNLRDYISPSIWERNYMGEEGSHSMYIDAVEGKFAKTSRSEERVDWNSVGLLDFFKSLC